MDGVAACGLQIAVPLTSPKVWAWRARLWNTTVLFVQTTQFTECISPCPLPMSQDTPTSLVSTSLVNGRLEFERVITDDSFSLASFTISSASKSRIVVHLCCEHSQNSQILFQLQNENVRTANPDDDPSDWNQLFNEAPILLSNLHSALKSAFFEPNASALAGRSCRHVCA